MDKRLLAAIAAALAFIAPGLAQTSTAAPYAVVPAATLEQPATISPYAAPPAPFVAQPPGVNGSNSGCGCSCERLWFAGDYTLGWIRAMSLPPLVTTSPAGTVQAS